jgi:hypothetical membrane protein
MTTEERPRTSATPAATETARVSAWVVATSASLPLILTGAWLIADACQPSAYSPTRQTVSVVAGYGGTNRWIMTSALYVAGVCYLAVAAGLTVLPTRARVGLVVAGLAAIGIASFPQPKHGSTTQHLICTGIGALAIGVWPALVGRRRVASPAHVQRMLVSVTATTASLSLLAWLVYETLRGDSVGLAERVSSSIQVSWPFVVALAFRLKPPDLSNDAVSRYRPKRGDTRE